MNPPTETQRQQINAEIFGGRNIVAIKLYREATGCQLMEAKQAVEGIEKELRQREPEKFARRENRSGCMGVFALVAVLTSAAWATLYTLRW